ncbi:hypothetical protein [Rhodoferax sp.]|uniref:hypothetical protein n=1 Tax=Rhodoferax sp. TaxID=50421 RepID=UPI00374CF2A4
MEKITNVMSVFDNGECWPHDALVFPEISKRGATKIVEKRWIHRGQPYQIDFQEEGYIFVDLLSDMTGFCALVGKHPWDMKKAYVLNGDASIRHILKPVFNIRGFDAERLAAIQKTDETAAKASFGKPTPHENQVMFHYKTERTDVLEIFGDDGFGDCYYRYDSTKGELLSTETLPRRS